MEQLYIIMLVVLAVLAIIDITVGVSNDAVNFLNSALGSKAVGFKVAMIVASIGILCGALFSNGMMEIARSGIYNPSMFSFNEVMIIFLSVMIADIILLDIFNSLGLPTSTTVSIVFELLGAAVCLAVIKILMQDGDLSTIYQYINTKKASEIVFSILLSVALSFMLGSLVQYISRVIFTFQTQDRIRKYGAIFGGFAISFISFFILVKGMKDVSFISKETLTYIKTHQLMILAGLFVGWTIISQVLMSFFKINILKLIIVIGTFALALSFAGNDLVNFIGVPIAAIQSFQFFSAVPGLDPNTYLMTELASNEIVAPIYYLFIAGSVMVITLWTSKKARTVIETEMSLARQGGGEEKFEPNFLARFIVRVFVVLGGVVDFILPKSLQLKLDKRFEKTIVKKSKKERLEEPAFDMVRASVNLLVASILIALGTSLKLPLSTTYVTFMVAMGTSFADKAWDRDTAVYRVSGVLKVIGGWFVTALGAFSMSSIVALFLYFGGVYAFVASLVILGIILYKSKQKHAKNEKIKEQEQLELSRADIVTIQEILNESSDQIARAITKTSRLYAESIENLSTQNLAGLKMNKRSYKTLDKEIDSLKSNIFNFVKNIDDTSVEASTFYVHTINYLDMMVNSVGYIVNNGFNHIDNNHKKLKFNQIKELMIISKEVSDLFDKMNKVFETKKYSSINSLMHDVRETTARVDEAIQKQIKRIRTSETSPKNSKMYFSILLESNVLLHFVIDLLEKFEQFETYTKNKK